MDCYLVDILYLPKAFGGTRIGNCATFFAYLKGKNLALQERPMIKPKDEAIGCTFLLRFLSNMKVGISATATS